MGARFSSTQRRKNRATASWPSCAALCCAFSLRASTAVASAPSCSRYVTTSTWVWVNQGVWVRERPRGRGCRYVTTSTRGAGRVEGKVPFGVHRWFHAVEKVSSASGEN